MTMRTSPLPSSQVAKPIVIAVDLHMLAPEGQNGGVKPAIYHSLDKIKQRWGEDIRFEFLVNRGVAKEVAARFGQDRVHEIQRHAEPLASTPRRRVPWRVRWLLRKADLLYAPLWFSPFHSSRRPTVVLMVDMLHCDHPEMLSGDVERLWREEIVGFSVRTASRVQTISRTMAERIHDHYGLPAERLFTTYLPLQDRHRGAGSATNNAEPRHGFFYPANLWPHKNHERLLAAYAQYRAKAGDAAWPLKLSGHQDAPRRAALEANARALGLLKDDVQFLGFLDDINFVKTWQTAGAMIFPSLYEGFGMPLLEAMRFGVPIGASRIAAIPEIVGEAALFFDPYDVHAIAETLLQLSSRPDLRSNLVNKGKERLQTFDADKEADKLVEAFFAAIQEFNSERLRK